MQLQAMTDTILGPGAQLWQVKRQHEYQLNAQRERALADTGRDPHWQVGRLAKVGMFIEALALLDEMLNSGRADETRK
jgi:pentatricopeptide repeat protein